MFVYVSGTPCHSTDLAKDHSSVPSTVRNMFRIAQKRPPAAPTEVSGQGKPYSLAQDGVLTRGNTLTGRELYLHSKAGDG